MKRTLLAFGALIVGANVQAFETYAPVVSTTPITETINRPTRQCWNEYREVSRPPEHDPGGAILGTIVGGLVGSQIGKGSGRVAAAAVGAGIGAVAGDRMANQDAHASSETVPVQRCSVQENLETRITGYRVTYEYNNYRFTTTMPYDPGKQVRVNVAVTPKL